jgi:protein-disulfide isomerase
MRPEWQRRGEVWVLSCAVITSLQISLAQEPSLDSMKTASLLSLILILFILPSDLSAQTSRRRNQGRPVTTKPPVSQSVAQPTPAPTPSATILLAVVNGQNVTTAELDPQVREEVNALPGRIAEARNRILELEINTRLLEFEARKRKITTQQLYDAEVTRKLTEPGPAEIDKFIADNRDQIYETDPVKLRGQVVAYLKAEREAKLSEALVQRLRTSTPVVMGADLAAKKPAPSGVLATVADAPIMEATVNERLKPIVYKLRLNVYLAQKPALDETINDILLLAEASGLNVAPEEIVRKEISEKVQTPGDAEVEKFYDENKSRLNGDLGSLRTQIANYLQDQNRRRLEQALAERLRKGATIRILISEPEAPVQAINVDDDPARGDATPPVTVVAFTDFQCPACAAMHPVIDEVLKPYGNKVRLVVRDFPLSMHPNARKAAEAANAAHAQGKFFDYAAILFKHQNALDVPSLKKYATELGLNRTLFDAALDSGKYAAEVRHDISEGEMYGIDSTPTIFVNGVALKALSAEELRAAIDRVLGAKSATSVSAP